MELTDQERELIELVRDVSTSTKWEKQRALRGVIVTFRGSAWIAEPPITDDESLANPDLPTFQDMFGDDDPYWEMAHAHEDEAERYGAEFLNYGKVIGADFILSKTGRGILETHIDPETAAVSHHWSSYE